MLVVSLWGFGTLFWTTHKKVVDERSRYQTATATIVRVNERTVRERDYRQGSPPRFRDRKERWVTVAFDTPARAIEGDASIAECENHGLPIQAGNRIAVFYDPSAPDRFVICSKEHSPGFAISVLIAAVLSTFWLLLTR